MSEPGELVEVYDQHLRKTRWCLLLASHPDGNYDILYQGRRQRTYRNDVSIPGIPIINPYHKKGLTGYVYAPYIPLQITSTFLSENGEDG